MFRLLGLFGATALCVASFQSASASLVLNFDFDNASDFTAGGSGAGSFVDFQDRGGSTINTGLGLVSGGVVGSADVQIRSDFDLGFDESLFGPGSFVEVRFRETSDGSTFLNAADFGTGDGRLFGGDVAYISPGAGNTGGTNINFGNALSAADDTDNFVVVRYGLDSFLSTRTGLRSLRFDPIESMAANTATFDLDYINVTAVPEPSSFAMVGLGTLGLLRRRRR